MNISSTVQQRESGPIFQVQDHSNLESEFRIQLQNNMNCIHYLVLCCMRLSSVSQLRILSSLNYDKVIISQKKRVDLEELRFALCKPTFMMTYHLAISSQFNWHNMVVIEFLPQLVWYLKLITLVLHLV